MCLFVDRYLTEKAKTRNPEVFVTRYKVFEKTSDKKLVSPIRHYVWKAGINKSNASNRSRLNVRKKTRWEVNRGIHVFINRKDAEALLYTYYDSFDFIVLPVKCKNGDLIAVDTKEEVYTQVAISKTAMRKA